MDFPCVPILRSLGQAAPDITAFIRAKTAAYPIFEMIERNTVRTSSSNNGRKLDKVEGHIQFKDVSFSYPSRPEMMIFNKLCLNIPAGKIVALVGGSGSGKSTIISLIERFYEPLSGDILLDGINIKDLDLKWLRQQIGLVNQEPALFATSIKENILYGKDDATLEDITRAAKLSEALTFINNLPDRFETQVLFFYYNNTRNLQDYQHNLICNSNKQFFCLFILRNTSYFLFSLHDN